MHHEKEEFKASDRHLSNAPQIKLVISKKCNKLIKEAYEECVRRYCDFTYPPSTIQIYPGTVIEKTDGSTWIMNCDLINSTIFLPGLMHKEANKKTYLEVVAPANCLFELMRLEYKKRSGKEVTVPEVIETASSVYSDDIAMEMDNYFHYLDLG